MSGKKMTLPKSGESELNIWLYCTAFALLIPILVPALQFGLIFRIWDIYNKPVNKEMCACSCWDTVFKAGYETGVSGYKHIYFNSTRQTLAIWIITVIAVIGLYEAVRHVAMLLYTGQGRPNMAILFFSSIYPHYYAWWSYFNYYNDDFYSQWWHQLFFTVTEMVSTVLVLHLVDKNNFAAPRKIVIIMSVAFLHIFASGYDQFVANVLRREGELHQVMRDLGFMLPDLIHIWLPWLELREVARLRGGIVPRPSHLIATKDAAVAVSSVFALWLFCAVIIKQ